MPYPVPALDAPVRVAFLGPAATSAAHALHDPVAGVLPRFIDVRAGADVRRVRSALADAAPHVAVVLAPDAVPPDALAGLRAATLAVVPPAIPAPEGYDRVLRTPGPDGGGAWRSRPLPVDDRLYAPVRRGGGPARAVCVGRSTEHREWVLTPSKHAHDVVHYAHGLVGAAFTEVMAGAEVGIALHAEPGGGFPSQALLHLAAGQLLISERLTPPAGLQPGIDFLPIDSREGLMALLHQLQLRPDAYERVRIRGRIAAEDHRASRVWPRIVRDLLHDLRLFGTTRTLHA
jgi:hypothetical protein